MMVWLGMICEREPNIFIIISYWRLIVERSRKSEEDLLGEVEPGVIEQRYHFFESQKILI